MPNTLDWEFANTFRRVLLMTLLAAWPGCASDPAANIEDAGHNPDEGVGTSKAGDAARVGRWRPIADGPVGRVTAGFWTGSEMLVWGGLCTDLEQANELGCYGGNLYNPSSDTWREVSRSGTKARFAGSMVWAGTELLVWGGECEPGQLCNDGAAYDPARDRWTPLPTANAPTPRQSHVAVWTGTEMIVWGGLPSLGTLDVIGDGGAYDPKSRTWRRISSAGGPEPRYAAQALWTRWGMVVWGGLGATQQEGSAGITYDPAGDRWSSLFGADAPAFDKTTSMLAIDDGLFVWTGEHGYIFDGRKTWTRVAAEHRPEQRRGVTLVWTGSEIIMWDGSGCPTGHGVCGDGGIYSPSMRQWTQPPLIGAPQRATGHSVVWTGTGMVVWGGWLPYRREIYASGAIFTLD